MARDKRSQAQQYVDELFTAWVKQKDLQPILARASAAGEDIDALPALLGERIAAWEKRRRRRRIAASAATVAIILLCGGVGLFLNRGRLANGTSMLTPTPEVQVAEMETVAPAVVTLTAEPSETPVAAVVPPATDTSAPSPTATTQPSATATPSATPPPKPSATPSPARAPTTPTAVIVTPTYTPKPTPTTVWADALNPSNPTLSTDSTLNVPVIDRDNLTFSYSLHNPDKSWSNLRISVEIAKWDWTAVTKTPEITPDGEKKYTTDKITGLASGTAYHAYIRFKPNSDEKVRNPEGEELIFSFKTK